jgi:hypothetical protein
VEAQVTPLEQDAAVRAFETGFIAGATDPSSTKFKAERTPNEHWRRGYDEGRKAVLEARNTYRAQMGGLW